MHNETRYLKQAEGIKKRSEEDKYEVYKRKKASQA